MGYLKTHLWVRYEPVYTGLQVTCAYGCECIDVSSPHHLNSTYTTEQAMNNENNQQKLNFFVVTDLYTATGIIEEFVDIPDGVDTKHAIISAWQYLIDSGHAWRLQGWYGRNAHALIQEGLCNPPQKS